MSDCFYRRVGDEYESTRLTTGPWSEHHQHAGPPAALLAREFEGLAASLSIVRLSYELMRPIPVTRLRLETKELKPGRRVRIFGGTLWAGDTELVRATALCLLPKPVEYSPPPRTGPSLTIPGPEDSEAFRFPFFKTEVGYHTAMECRCGRGGVGDGHAVSWLRMRHPLVFGEAPSPLQRVVIAADSGNGVSTGLDWKRYSFINPDLTVYMHRLPEGEWVALNARSTSEANGIGLADDQLHDERGPLGRAVQSLLLSEVSL